MYVVINIDPGSTLNELMAFMTQKTITFSVTDQLSRLCDRSVNEKKREAGTQTEDSSLLDAPPSKKPRVYNGEDYGSPCSSATPSEPNDLAMFSVAKVNGNGSNGSGNDASTNGHALNWVAEPAVLRGLIKNEMMASTVKEEPEEASVEDEMSTEYMQNQLIQALFPPKNGETFGTLEDNESLEGESAAANGDLSSGTFPMDGSPVSAIRYKPAYASTKRGVCHVCNREVSLITTHRRRHAITHLGFKTLKCALCYKFFSRQDLATGHFKKDHPTEEFTPFVDTMSAEDERQLVIMMGLCFPEEHAPRKRGKEGEAGGGAPTGKKLKEQQRAE
ncbi:unnamed protein product [Caenorhabditis sp. 36 PRJEB53466]|nr:unnamed protein product [Caenorhabditis sp. 36 PRJEB53466]